MNLAACLAFGVHPAVAVVTPYPLHSIVVLVRHKDLRAVVAEVALAKSLVALEAHVVPRVLAEYSHLHVPTYALAMLIPALSWKCDRLCMRCRFEKKSEWRVLRSWRGWTPVTSVAFFYVIQLNNG